MDDTSCIYDSKIFYDLFITNYLFYMDSVILSVIHLDYSLILIILISKNESWGFKC